MIDFRKNISKFERSTLLPAIDEAKSFLRTIYGDQVNLENVNYIFNKGVRSRYYRNEITNELVNCKYLLPNVCISVRNDLILYQKKSLKLKNYQIKVDLYTQVICALIHELTHHIQYELNAPISELETTKNEVDYLKIYKPIYYRMLTI